MVDEMARLHETQDLHQLLTHYATLAGPDRQAWHHRLMALEGCEGKALTGLHGELIAHGWLEMDIDQATCYRVTTTGLRALKQAQSEE